VWRHFGKLSVYFINTRPTTVGLYASVDKIVVPNGKFLITSLRSLAWLADKQVGPMSVLVILDRNVHWPRRVLPRVSHVEYAPSALLRLERRPDRQRMDGRKTITLRLPLEAVSGVSNNRQRLERKARDNA